MILATALVLKKVENVKCKKRLTRQTYSGIGVLVCSIM